MKITSILKPTLILTVLFLSAATHCLARDVTLEWDANVEPDLDGYIIYYDTDSGVPYNGNDANEGASGAIMVGQNITSIQLTGLTDGQTYYFTITAIDDEGLESAMGREVCVLGTNELDSGYDRGWAISRGNLEGFKVMYSSTDGVTPTLGPSGDIPTLNLTGINPLGSPLNLQPSPTIFNTPVKIFIPCSGYSDFNGIDVYYYDEVAGEWSLAADAGNWMVPGSIEEHYETSPYTISIQIHHFSGAQAGVSSSSSASGSGGGCFIATSSL